VTYKQVETVGKFTADHDDELTGDKAPDPGPTERLCEIELLDPMACDIYIGPSARFKWMADAD